MSFWVDIKKHCEWKLGHIFVYFNWKSQIKRIYTIYATLNQSKFLTLFAKYRKNTITAKKILME